MVSWVRLNINETYTGVYVNAEQRNKQFLRNRELFTPDETWLYKVGDINGLELKVGVGESPTVGSAEGAGNGLQHEPQGQRV